MNRYMAVCNIFDSFFLTFFDRSDITTPQQHSISNMRNIKCMIQGLYQKDTTFQES